MEKQWTCDDDILCGINEPKDRQNLQDLEKKHLPVIEALEKAKKDEPFEVKVRIGGIDGVEHPNEAGHFIEWIELYCGDTYLGRASYSGGASYPQAIFKVKLSHAHGPLKARGKCNLHGLWENKKEISLE